MSVANAGKNSGAKNTVAAMKNFPIKTSFGSIRPYVMEDADHLALYANNRRIWLNLRDGFPFPYTIANAVAFLEMVGRQNPVTYFALATPEHVIGSIGIVIGQDIHRMTAEMGYWLAEPFWGKGIMTEAVRLFSDAVLNEFGLVRVFAEPFADNQASCRILEKAGFEREGCLRRHAFKDGRFKDMILYSKIR